MEIAINIKTQIKIVNSNKDFLLFDIGLNNKISHYKTTNDLQRYKNKYQHFRVLSCIKQEINNSLIKIR